jgi:hypothetical protein
MLGGQQGGMGSSPIGNGVALCLGLLLLAMCSPSPAAAHASALPPLAIASPTPSVEQRLGLLEGKTNELIDKTKVSQAKDIVDLIHTSVVVIAVVVSGVWGYWLFVQNRQRYPRASIKHSITHVPLSDGKVLLHVTETVRNEGSILLSLECMQTRLQRVEPPPDDLLRRIAEGKPVLAEGKTEYLWPLIGLHERGWDKGQCEIEPNESQDIHHDFLIDAEVNVLEVYSYMKNFVKRKREIGWNLTTFHDLRQTHEVPGQDERMKR